MKKSAYNSSSADPDPAPFSTTLSDFEFNSLSSFQLSNSPSNNENISSSLYSSTSKNPNIQHQFPTTNTEQTQPPKLFFNNSQPEQSSTSIMIKQEQQKSTFFQTVQSSIIDEFTTLDDDNNHQTLNPEQSFFHYSPIPLHNNTNKIATSSPSVSFLDVNDNSDNSQVTMSSVPSLNISNSKDASQSSSPSPISQEIYKKSNVLAANPQSSFKVSKPFLGSNDSKAPKLKGRRSPFRLRRNSGNSKANIQGSSITKAKSSSPSSPGSSSDESPLNLPVAKSKSPANSNSEEKPHPLGVYEERLAAGIKLVRNGNISIRAAAKQVDVSHETLRRRCQGACSRQDFHPQLMALTPAEEQMIEDMMVNCFITCGNLLTSSFLKNIVNGYRRNKALQENSTPPKDLGISWTAGFRRRHEKASEIMTKSMSREKIDSSAVNHGKLVVNPYSQWASEVSEAFKNYDISQENIYNLVDIGFLQEKIPKAKDLAAETSSQEDVNASNDQSEPPIKLIKRADSLKAFNNPQVLSTSLECICADGTYLPSLYSTMAASATENKIFISENPSEDGYGILECTENGWANETSIYDWMTKIFDPLSKSKFNKEVFSKNDEFIKQEESDALKQQGENSKLPYRVICMEACGSHFSTDVLKFAMENRILFVIFPSQSSSQVQPFDLQLFDAFKNRLSQNSVNVPYSYSSEKENDSNSINWDSYFEVLKKSRQQSFTNNHIFNGWLKSPLSLSFELTNFNIKSEDQTSNYYSSFFGGKVFKHNSNYSETKSRSTSVSSTLSIAGSDCTPLTNTWTNNSNNESLESTSHRESMVDIEEDHFFGQHEEYPVNEKSVIINPTNDNHPRKSILQNHHFDTLQSENMDDKKSLQHQYTNITNSVTFETPTANKSSSKLQVPDSQTVEYLLKVKKDFNLLFAGLTTLEPAILKDSIFSILDTNWTSMFGEKAPSEIVEPNQSLSFTSSQNSELLNATKNDLPSDSSLFSAGVSTNQMQMDQKPQPALTLITSSFHPNNIEYSENSPSAYMKLSSAVTPDDGLMSANSASIISNSSNLNTAITPTSAAGMMNSSFIPNMSLISQIFDSSATPSEDPDVQGKMANTNNNSREIIASTKQDSLFKDYKLIPNSSAQPAQFNNSIRTEDRSITVPRLNKQDKFIDDVTMIDSDTVNTSHNIFNDNHSQLQQTCSNKRVSDSLFDEFNLMI